MQGGFDTAAADFPWRAHYPEGTRHVPGPGHGTVPALFASAAARFAERPAVDYAAARLTYAELDRRVAEAAGRLRAAGIGPGTTLGLYLPNTAWHPVLFFGALRAGARVAHLSPLDAGRVLAHKLKDSEAVALVTVDLPPMLEAAKALGEAGAAPRVVVCEEAEWGADGAGVPPWATAWSALPDGPAPEPVAAPEDVALLQYTGGTTGLPKGAMLTHGNLTAAVAIYDAWYGDDADPTPDVAMCVLPLFHIYALTTILLRQIDQGSEILIRRRFDAAAAVDDIERRRVTLFAGVPTMWIAVANLPGIETRDLSSLRLCASGGAPLPVEVGRRFQRLTGIELLGGWGMTETSPAGTGIPAGAATGKPGTVGVPLPGIEMRIVDHDDPGRELAPGETGEFAIRGANITQGYWRRPEETAKAFHGDWFLTGDVGYMDADGFFWLVDRKSDLILSGGFNVYPQMVEQAIYEHPAVAECLVIGVPDDYRGESAKAFVVLREGHDPFTLDALAAFLEGRLGRHEMPRGLEFRETLPRTPVGKLSRKELREEAAAQRGETR
ncbi:MAG: AMP-binding protein [Paracoccaceae bacterium]